MATQQIKEPLIKAEGAQERLIGMISGRGLGAGYKGRRTRCREE